MIVSIDPGKKGGAALWTNKGEMAGTYRFNLPSIPRFPSWELMDDFMQWIPPKRTTTCVIEALPDFRTMGAIKHKNTQGATWGEQYLAVLLRCKPDISTHIVEARMWKKHFGLTSDKKEALALAREMHPNLLAIGLEGDDGVAEAILIGHYYFDKIRGKQ